MSNERKAALQYLMAKYGVDSQIVKTLEEMAELAVVLTHRYFERYSNPAEEIADVENMLDQLKVYYANERQVNGWKRKKLERQIQRANGS